MKVYVTAPLEWTLEMSLREDFGSQPDRSAQMSTVMVDAVLAADAAYRVQSATADAMAGTRTR